MISRSYGGTVRRTWGRNVRPHIQGRVVRRDGRSPDWIEFYQVYEQGYRVADDSLAVYELYVGNGQAPDFTQPPAATSATLPFSWEYPSPSPGETTQYFYCVVRQRDKYGLQSFNVFETVVAIDVTTGRQVYPPTTPIGTTIEESFYVPGNMSIASMYTAVNDPKPADTWNIYANVGSAPTIDPAHLVHTEAMIFSGNVARLFASIGPYNAGDVVYAVVIAERTKTYAGQPVGEITTSSANGSGSLANAGF